MIKNPENIEGTTMQVLTHSEQFWACGGAIGSNVIDMFTVEDSPLPANSKCYGEPSIRWGFLATSYAELLAEIDVRGYEFPIQE